MTNAMRVILLGVMCAGLVAAWPAVADSPATARASYAELPLSFEAHGDTGAEGTRYVARGADFAVHLDAAEMQLFLSGARPDEAVEHRLLRVELVGGRPVADSEALDPLRGRVNYLIGADAAGWRTDVPTFGKVRFRDIYPGIDIVYYGNNGRLQYDFIVQPGADPGCVVLSVEGADSLETDPKGNLVMRCGDDALRFLAPLVYQERNGEHVEIASRFVLHEDARCTFDLGAYDPAIPLVIDPVVEFSSYAGMPSAETRGVGVDAQGNMYIAGSTFVPEPSFPGARIDSPLGGGQNTFVIKFSPDGQEVLYATFLGGNDKDAAKCMYVDAQGFAYVGGNTKSTDLPTAGFIGHYAATYDFLVFKLNPDGGLGYCCVFGGESMEEMRGITVDAQGNCIAVGGSHSPDLPTTPGSFQPVYKDPPEETPEKAGSFRQGEDAVIAKINPAGTEFVFCTFLGGHGFEKAWAVAVDKADNIYVTGHVEALDFPVTEGAFQASHAGGAPRALNQYGPKDAFVAKLSPDGTRVRAATYFGGSGQDVGYGIGLDDAGHVYIAGNTDSPDIPTLNAVSDRFGGGKSDIFVACLDPALTRLRYATYWGGAGDVEISSDGFVVDRRGYAYATGRTNAPIATTPGAHREAYAGGDSDGYLLRLNPAGQVDYATLIGGSGTDTCGDIAQDHRGGVYVSGSTNSSDFKLQAPLRDAKTEDRDAFLMKFQFDAAAAKSAKSAKPLTLGQMEFCMPSPAIPFYHFRLPVSLPERGPVHIDRLLVNGEPERNFLLLDAMDQPAPGAPQTERRLAIAQVLKTPRPERSYDELILVGRVPWRAGLRYTVEVTLSLGHEVREALSGTAEGAAPKAGGYWDPAWTHYQSAVLTETAGLDRAGEPVQVTFLVYPDTLGHPAREVRVVRYDARRSEHREVPSQILDYDKVWYSEAPMYDEHGKQRTATYIPTDSVTVAFQADVPASNSVVYLLFYGNPDATAPEYTSDLRVTGEAPGRTVENVTYRFQLHPLSGMLDEITLKSKPEHTFVHKLETNGAIQWNPDCYSPPRPWVHSSDWEPGKHDYEYEEIQGPLVFRTRRWGMMPLMPEVTTSMEYEFYAGLPYFLMRSTMHIRYDVAVQALRNAEVVFERDAFSEAAWFDPETKRVQVRHIVSAPDLTEWMMPDTTPWVAFFDRQKGCGYGGIQLGYLNGGLSGKSRTLNPFMYVTVGPWIYWTRSLAYPYGTRNPQQLINIPAGSVFLEEWAYIPFELQQKNGELFTDIESWHARLTHPLLVHLDEPSDPRMQVPEEIYIEPERTGWGDDAGYHR